jgi:hypothetical protein
LLEESDKAASGSCACRGGWIRVSYFKVFWFGAVGTPLVHGDNLPEDTILAR